jgi:hypothetical protein
MRSENLEQTPPSSVAHTSGPIDRVIFPRDQMSSSEGRGRAGADAMGGQRLPNPIGILAPYRSSRRQHVDAAGGIDRGAPGAPRRLGSAATNPHVIGAIVELQRHRKPY